jgi:hypothetical protein
MTPKDYDKQIEQWRDTYSRPLTMEEFIGSVSASLNRWEEFAASEADHLLSSAKVEVANG